MSEKHTPGPWFVGPLVSMTAGTVNEPGAYSITDNADPNLANVLCSRYPWRERAEEMAANARLIAAAPELLEALQRLLSAYAVSHSPESRASCWAQAHAAIAKATGEQA